MVEDRRVAIDALAPVAVRLDGAALGAVAVRVDVVGAALLARGDVAHLHSLHQELR